MEFINSTRMAAGYTMGIDPSGRELLIVAVKGTFAIPPEMGSPLRLHEEQVPLVTSDEFFGEPGRSAPKYEIDFAPRKARCDVLLNASAWAPDGRPATRVTVGVQLGSWSKTFDVVGDRVWEAGVTGVGASAAIPFRTLPITYDRAFGGTDDRSPDPSRHAAFMANPSGRGFHAQVTREFVDRSPLPNTEESGHPVTRVNGSYRPMSFGPIGRHWEPRVRFAGTYDQRWLDEVFPFLPADFDERYYQAAPIDQQLPKLAGDHLVRLVNLTPEGRREFVIPHFVAPVHIFPRRGMREDLEAHLDTLLIEPDAARVMMTWRLARPLRRDLFEIAQVLVGRKGRDWWQAREESGFPITLQAVPAR
jgi:hypothetical protein